MMRDANPSDRCLTRLQQLTGPELLLELWPVVLRIARLVFRFRESGPSPEAAYHFEMELDKLLRELGRRIVQWTFNHLEPQEVEFVPGRLIWDGDYYRAKRLSPTRNLNCLFGKIRVRRWLYEPVEQLGLSCWFPLEAKLGLVIQVATPALADRVARLAVEFSQTQTLAILRDQHSVVWGAKTLRKVTAAWAEGLSPHRQALQSQQVLQWLAEAAATSGPRRILLCVGRDGVMMPIRGLQKYKEGAVATVSVYNRWGKRLGTVYLGHMPEEGQTTLSDQLTALIREVLAGYQGPPLRLAYVTDAGFHPTDYYENVLCRMSNPWRPGEYLHWEWVVDYYHACKYINDLSEVIFGRGQAACAWSSKMRRVLRDKPGGVFRVLRSAGALCHHRGLMGEESDYQGAYGYLRRHAGSMDYSRHRRLKMPIGSGVTEAACKIVVSQRFKRAGMKWDIETGQPIMVLRTTALSGIWEAARTMMLTAQNAKQPRTPRQNRDAMLQNAA